MVVADDTSLLMDINQCWDFSVVTSSLAISCDDIITSYSFSVD